MSITLRFEANEPAGSAELMIERPLPHYHLEKTESSLPHELDSLIASEGFQRLLEEVRTVLERELADSNLEIVRIRGVVCHDVNVYRPGILLAFRERGASGGMSEPARRRFTAIAETIRERLRLP